MKRKKVFLLVAVVLSSILAFVVVREIFFQQARISYAIVNNTDVSIEELRIDRLYGMPEVAETDSISPLAPHSSRKIVTEGVKEPYAMEIHYKKDGKQHLLIRVVDDDLPMTGSPHPFRFVLTIESVDSQGRLHGTFDNENSYKDKNLDVSLQWN